MKKCLPHHMNSVLVEARDAFKVSASNIIMGSFEKTILPPLSPPYLVTNTQAYAASIQVYSDTKSEEINNILRQKVAPIELQLISTDDCMFVLLERVTQQFSRNIILQATVYEAVIKITVIPIQ